MYWKLFCRETVFQNQFGTFVKIKGPDIKTGENYWIYIKYKDYLAVHQGVGFQEAFKEYSEETLEFMLRGNAPKYSCPITNEQKISHKAYVTNASANSVVFYAGAYLNNMGLSLTTIAKLREKYTIGNLNDKFFTVKELRESFINQSAFFLNLYRKMNEHDRFEHFVSGLDDERFRNIFARYDNASSVKRNYNRRIFHDKFECLSMRNHYDEEVFHANTGVFVENKIVENSKFYIIEKNYLENLKMRRCKICENNHS